MAANVSAWSFIAISAFTLGGAGVGLRLRRGKGWAGGRGAKKREGEEQKEKEGKGGDEVVNSESGLDAP